MTVAKKAKTRRGKCPICDRRVRLRANGTISSHWLYADLRVYCSGIGEKPKEAPC